MNGNILAYLGLAGNEGMDPYSSPYINHYCRFHVLFHSFIPSSLISSQLGVSGVVRWKGPHVTGKGGTRQVTDSRTTKWFLPEDTTGQQRGQCQAYLGLTSTVCEASGGQLSKIHAFKQRPVGVSGKQMYGMIRPPDIASGWGFRQTTYTTPISGSQAGSCVIYGICGPGATCPDAAFVSTTSSC